MRGTTLFTGFILMIGMLSLNIAQAQLETLVMPGEVIADHADIETECKSCHVAFDRDKQSELCMDCHEDVAADRGSKQGFHGLDRYAQRRDCSFCHVDHEGRDANIVPLDESSFKHKATDFPLHGKHEDVACGDCHESGKKHREASSDCVTCHEADNVHGETMGPACGDCHSPVDWAEFNFDHDTTGFNLIGKHRQAACLDCHADQTFLETPTTCYGCHASDDAHDGRSGRECDSCHKPTDWLDTSFNHARDTSFDLTGKHAMLTCDDCHSEDPFSDQLTTTCFSCHEDDDNHDRHFGESCDSCHVTDEWAQVAFDHNVDTKHALRGAHTSVECTACHIEPVFDAQPPSTCGNCHEEDDPHKGTQGAMCEDCHNEHSWTESVFFDHDLTRFPLLGKHKDTDCTSCHETQRFRDASMECKSCHEPDDPHGDRFPSECAVCHSPVDWSNWRFDHDKQTSFPLDGAHSYADCETCHRQSLDVQLRMGSRCNDCHRTDDIHNGEFGFDCGRCHSTDSFEEVQQIQ